ncbi:hypothetical protein HID58_019681 [Brassica napus]|uniref:Uncharacterized protein n=1 Tax=Brassica napus TaxID=3708 RepID=A0ABQ8DDE9_BRANA|nr:hypothetical protein HID58_019681 [Brassica napus]
MGHYSKPIEREQREKLDLLWVPAVGRRVLGGERERFTYSEVVFFREVEASADPPSPALASGKGVSVRFAFAGFWLRRAEASKAPRCRLGTRVSLGKGCFLGSICIKSGVVVVKGEVGSLWLRTWRDDMAVKRGYGFVGGLPVSELRRTRMTMVFIPAAFWRSGQVEAVTPRDA